MSWAIFAIAVLLLVFGGLVVSNGATKGWWVLAWVPGLIALAIAAALNYLKG